MPYNAIINTIPDRDTKRYNEMVADTMLWLWGRLVTRGSVFWVGWARAAW